MLNGKRTRGVTSCTENVGRRDALPFEIKKRKLCDVVSLKGKSRVQKNNNIETSNSNLIGTFGVASHIQVAIFNFMPALVIDHDRIAHVPLILNQLLLVVSLFVISYTLS